MQHTSTRGAMDAPREGRLPSRPRARPSGRREVSRGQAEATRGVGLPAWQASSRARSLREPPEGCKRRKTGGCTQRRFRRRSPEERARTCHWTVRRGFHERRDACAGMAGTPAASVRGGPDLRGTDRPGARGDHLPHPDLLLPPQGHPRAADPRQPRRGGEGLRLPPCRRCCSSRCSSPTGPGPAGRPADADRLGVPLLRLESGGLRASSTGEASRSGSPSTSGWEPSTSCWWPRSGASPTTSTARSRASGCSPSSASAAHGRARSPAPRSRAGCSGIFDPMALMLTSAGLLVVCA